MVGPARLAMIGTLWASPIPASEWLQPGLCVALLVYGTYSPEDTVREHGSTLPSIGVRSHRCCQFIQLADSQHGESQHSCLDTGQRQRVRLGQDASNGLRGRQGSQAAAFRGQRQHPFRPVSAKEATQCTNVLVQYWRLTYPTEQHARRQTRWRSCLRPVQGH
jgi:hypothetical protein